MGPSFHLRLYDLVQASRFSSICVELCFGNFCCNSNNLCDAHFARDLVSNLEIFYGYKQFESAERSMVL